VPTNRLKARLRFTNHLGSLYLFLLPSLLGFLVFIVAPVIGSLGLSLMRWNLLTAPGFVGINDYVEIFTRDPVFGQAFWNTLSTL
jgi:ABC-type sugar transport system permease subunit